MRLGGLDRPNVNWQYHLVAKVTNSILGCINRTVASTPREVIIPLYSELIIRPNLEHYIGFWASQYRRTSINKSEFSRGPARWLEAAIRACEKGLREQEPVQPGEEKASGEHNSHIPTHMMK